MAIAKQRAEQEIQEVSLKVDALMNGIKESGDAKTAAITAMTQLKLQIDSAKKKAKKTLQLTLELLEKRLEN